jgi:ribosomal protein S18 acetylase RimI-like enzyme
MVWPKLRSVRIILLGVKKEYRTLGLGIPMYRQLFETAVKKGYRAGEASWILDDNKPMVAALEAMGSRVYKKYRIYRGEAS